MKKPTPAQLAARKLFAERARAGTLKRKKKATAKNPIKRTNISKRAYVKRPSQATGAAPTKRLTKRRKLVASGNAPQGYFPNPKSAKLYTVHKADVHGNSVYHIAHFRKLADAKQYAQAYADLHKTRVAITSKKL